MMKIRNYRGPLTLFLIHPFSSLFFAFRNYREPWAKNMLWAFVAFYGFTMVTSDTALDSSRYKEQFLQVHDAMRTGSAGIGDAITLLGDGKLDLFQPVLTTLVAAVTGHASLLFLALGIVYGYFYSRNIWFLLEHIKISRKYTWAFALAFAVVIGFWELNGFRMWTAAHVFFFGAVRFLLYRKRKWLLVPALTPLIHFSFAIPLLCLLVFALVGARKRLFFIFYVASLLVQSVNLEAINTSLKEFMPDNSVMDTKMNGYLNEDYAAGVKAEAAELSFHAALYQFSLKLVLTVALLLGYRRFASHDDEGLSLKHLYAFVLLFLGLANILSNIPSGGRFVNVANLFALCLLFLYLSRHTVDRITRRLVIVAVPLLLFFSVVSVRVGFDTMNLQVVVSNPLIALCFPYERSVISVIK